MASGTTVRRQRERERFVPAKLASSAKERGISTGVESLVAEWVESRGKP